ncbi:MAG TPA: LPS export ABC transporter permease LptF [Steroidobacteraceae bacterium]|nr:LPS export ABC transporter permease LptF [Steroidobacteraceae bacterium]
MRVIERYVLREVAMAWAAVSVVLFVILISNQLAFVFKLVAEAGLSSKVVLNLLWFRLVQQFLMLLPIGLFLGIMLALGRMYHESEMAAMQACGVSHRDVLRPVMLLAGLAAATLAWLSLDVAPHSAQAEIGLKTQAAREARFASLQPGKFRSFGGSNIVFYAESIDEHGVLHNVYAQRMVGDRMEIVVASRAEQHGVGDAEQTFVLYDGERYEGTPGSAQFRIWRFAEHGIPVQLPDVGNVQLKDYQKSTFALLRSGKLSDYAELQSRISTPLVVLILAVIAVPLSKLRPRQGRYARAGQFILVYLVYLLLLQSAQSWMMRGVTPYWLGIWWAHAVLVVMALLLWRRAEGKLNWVWR